MFRIGEFSTIAQVSGRQLRNYDRLGLLKPVHIDEESGYRYYSASQLPRLNRILALKELGLTLDQIAHCLDENIPVGELYEMLQARKAQFEQEMREALQHFKYIESRIHQIEDTGTSHDYDVVVKSVPAQRYLSLRTIVSPRLGEARVLLLEMQRVLSQVVDSRALGLGTIVLHSQTWDEEAIDMEIGFIIHNEKDYRVNINGEHVMTMRDLPAMEKMVTTLHTGLPREGHRSYSAIGRWVEANGHRFTGPGRKVFINLPPAGDEEQTVTEIQFPVEKVVSATLQPFSTTLSPTHSISTFK